MEDNNISNEYSLDCLIDASLYKIHLPEKEIENESILITERVLEDGKMVYYIKIPIEYGFNRFSINFKFKSKLNGEYSVSSGVIRYTAISLEEYNKRPGEKMTIVLSIVTLALLTSFVGVKNLMDIWDREVYSK